MSIEFSLRRRATQARCLAALWLCLATTILIGTYLSLPLIVAKSLNSISKIEGQLNNNAASDFHVQIFVMVIAVLGLLAISFACFLLGRSAFVEIELAARFNGLADAFCIAGNDFAQFEKAANLLVPKAKYLSVPEIFSGKDLKSLADVLKQLR